MEWRDNLYQHEETPPKKVWDALAKELQEEPHRLRHELLRFEAVPTAHCWESISAALSPIPRTEEQKVPQIVPLYRKILPYAASVAAACTIIAISIWIMDHEPGKMAAGISSLSGSRASGKNLGTVQTDSNQTPGSVGSHDQHASIPAETKPSTTKNESTARSTVVTQTLPSAMTVSRQEITPSYARRKTKKFFTRVRFQDRNYIQVCDANGNWSRINYKLEEMVGSLQQKDAPDATRYWESKLSDWQQRMGRSTYMPAPGHFFDIIDMASALQEEQ
jgi:hypothetical protein